MTTILLGKECSTFLETDESVLQRAELGGSVVRSLAHRAFKKVGDDLPLFATGGLTALIGEQK